MKCCSDMMIMEYLDGQLPRQQMRMVKAHLEDCSECSALLAEYELLYDQLGSSEQFEPSAGFTANVIRNLPETDFKKIIWKVRIYQVIALLIIFGLTALPYISILHNLGPVWDGAKIYFTIFTNICNIVFVFIEAAAVVLEQILKLLRLAGSVIQLQQNALFIISAVMLLAHGLLIKYFLLKIDWRNLKNE